MSSELVPVPTQEVAPPSDIWQAVLRASMSPDFSADNLKILVDLQRSQEDREREREFNQAFIALQAELPVIRKGHWNAGSKSLYCKIEDIEKVVRPLYIRHGFAFSYSTEPHPTDPKAVIAIGNLMHKSGHTVISRLPIAVEKAGAMTMTQAAGNTKSYARRYLLIDMLGIVTEGIDNDGQGKAISKDQENRLLDLLLTIPEPVKQKFMAHFGIADVSELPEARFADALDALTKTKQKLEAKRA